MVFSKDDKVCKDGKGHSRTFGGFVPLQSLVSLKSFSERPGLIRVASFLLERQLRQLEQAFVQEGGLRERMTRARLKERSSPKKP